MAVKISELLPQPVQVNTGRGLLDLHPLDLAQIVHLIKNYREPLMHMIETGRGGKPDYVPLLETAPEMVAALIAMSAQAMGQEADVRRLPGPVQLTALAEIWRLSVPEPKKLVASLSEAMEALAENLPKPAVALPTSETGLPS